jgi:hypothetical protein
MAEITKERRFLMPSYGLQKGNTHGLSGLPSK